MCLYVKAFTGEMSGYWSQVVRLSPGKYVLRGWFRLLSGKLLIYVHGRNNQAAIDQRFYAGIDLPPSLVPTFLKPQYLIGGRSDDWHPFTLPFEMPQGLPAVAVSLGMYFTAGEVWFDDVSLTVAETHLRVRVRGPQGIRQVTVFRVGSEKPLWQSPTLAPGQATFQHTLSVPATGRYRVVATSSSGRTIEKLYPE